ncbi:sensor histidine kinase [Halomicrobium katesii]|uniref:sensor histidine kinase n=1 Tax=Halomicrobium katesii TaxID=437163 RepID=UPI001FDFBE0F|nr:HAMP domain-containing sensor histidine kinase [Halomicrobium katesii]
MGQSGRIRTNAETASVREAADSIHSAAENIGSIVESVKQIEDAVDQKGSPSAPQNATKILRDVSAAVSSDCPKANISINAQDELQIPADEALTYALRHALENAITHSSETEPTIRIFAEALPDSDRIKISIRDNNPPIPKCEIDSIRDHESITATSHGTGVGLFIIKWCVESLGGEIEINRVQPRGNEVLIYFPTMRPAAVSLGSGCDAY